jgi:membrane-associated protease RseP (regulator of RpoE activity)
LSDLSASVVSFLSTYDIYIAAFVVFWSIVWMAKRFLPKSITIHPFVIMWRTTRFNDFIDRISRSGKLLWKALWNLGIAISLGAMIFIFYTLAQNLYNLFFRPASASPVSLLIPGVTISLDLTTLLSVGFSVGIIIIFHELSHGIAARVEGLKVKNTGLLLAAIIPGAFVEPDEGDLKKAKKSSQARVFAAGSSTNIWMAMVVIVVLANAVVVLSPFYQTNSSGVLLLGIVPGSPAAGVLSPGDVILSINGSPVTDVQSLSQVLKNTTPNSTVPMTLLQDGVQDQIEFKLGYSSVTNQSFIGISPFSNYYQPKASFYSPAFPYYFSYFLSWLELLSLNIGLINMLPVPFFDGGSLANIISRFILKDEKKGDQLSNILLWLALIILILNISLSFVYFPTFRLG